MKESEILEQARGLLVKYFHPARLGHVPTDAMILDMAAADALLQLAAHRASKEEHEPTGSI